MNEPVSPSSHFPGSPLLILGAARCGTTSVFELLRAHPDVCASIPKEPFFFEDEYDQGLAFYRARYFPHWQGQPLLVEARVAHLLLPYVAPRIQATLPTARFVVLLREPCERAFAHWAYKYQMGVESRSFDVAVADERRRLEAGSALLGPDAERIWRAHIVREPTHVAFDTYLETGHYAAHLERFFTLFPRERFLILTLDELRHDPAEVARRLHAFAGLAPRNGLATVPSKNATRATGPRLLHIIDQALHLSAALPESWRLRLRAWSSRLQRPLTPRPETMRELRAYFATHDLALRDLLGWERCPWQKDDALPTGR